MNLLIGLLARWGLPESLRRPMAWIGLAMTAFALLWLLRGCYDRAVVARHEGKVAASEAKATVRAMNEAARSFEHHRAEADAADAQTREAIQKCSELFATMGFGFFLGSSLGSKDKTARMASLADDRGALDLTGAEVRE